MSDLFLNIGFFSTARKWVLSTSLNRLPQLPPINKYPVLSIHIVHTKLSRWLPPTTASHTGFELAYFTLLDIEYD